MKIIKRVENIELNEGALQANGLYNLSNDSDVSYWFDEEIKNKLLLLSDSDFLIEAKKLIYKPSLLELDRWYFEKDLDVVGKITGIFPMEYDEADDIKDEDTMSRDEAIDEARIIWNAMSYNDKLEYYLTY